LIHSEITPPYFHHIRDGTIRLALPCFSDQRQVIHAGHGEVRYQQIPGHTPVNLRQCLQTVAGSENTIAQLLHCPGQHLAHDRIVVHDQHAGRSR
jgi:hypothetical protein